MKSFLVSLLLISTTCFGSYQIPDNGVTIAKLNTQTSSSQDVMDCAVSTSVATNALTIALKNNAGNDPTAAVPCRVAFRNATAATGTYSVILATAATSLVVPANATLGCQSTIACPLFVYAINNAGTLVLGVTGISQLDEGTVQSSTAIGTGSTSAAVLYATSSLSSKALRLISRVTATEATAGTWATTPSEVSPYPFQRGRVYAATYSPTDFTASTTSASFSTVSNSAVATSRVLFGLAITPSSTNDFALKIASLPPGTYLLTASFLFNSTTGGNSCSVRLTDGSTVIGQGTTGGDAAIISGISGPIAYTSTQSPAEFKVQIYSTAGVTCDFGKSNGGQNVIISITLVQIDK